MNLSRKVELTIFRLLFGFFLLGAILISDAMPLYWSLPTWMQIYFSIILSLGIIEAPRVLLIIGDFADWHFAKWAVMIIKFIEKKLGIKRKEKR